MGKRDDTPQDERQGFMDRHDPNRLRAGVPWLAAATTMVGGFIGGKVGSVNAHEFTQTLPERAKEVAVEQMAQSIQEKTPAPEEFKAEFARREREARQQLVDSHDGWLMETAKSAGKGAAIGAAVPPLGYSCMIGHSVGAGLVGGIAERRRRKQMKKTEPGI